MDSQYVVGCIGGLGCSKEWSVNRGSGSGRCLHYGCSFQFCSIRGGYYSSLLRYMPYWYGWYYETGRNQMETVQIRTLPKAGCPHLASEMWDRKPPTATLLKFSPTPPRWQPILSQVEGCRKKGRARRRYRSALSPTEGPECRRSRNHSSAFFPTTTNPRPLPPRKKCEPTPAQIS